MEAPLNRTAVAITLVALLALRPQAAAAQATPVPALPIEEAASHGFSPERLDRMHANLRRVVDEGRASGYVSLLARDGRIVDLRAHGQRDREGGAPMTPDTIFRVYSMSKLVTAVAALLLVEEGRLQLDDPVERFLPALRSRSVLVGGHERPRLIKAKGSVTVRHLLSHTAGYAYDFGGKGPLEDTYRKAKIWEAASLDDFVARASALPLSHQPGTAFRYGINTDLLGAVIEKASGQPFDRFVQERLLAPLGMTDTSFDVAPEKRTRLAKVYARDEQGQLKEAEPVSSSYPEEGRGFASGGGGLFSTAGDYARFAQMLLNGGRLGDRRLLSRKTVELMTQNQLSLQAKPFHAYSSSRGFGLGTEVLVELGQSGTLGSPGQFGWYGAATTYCQIDPRERIVALLFFQHFPMDEPGVFALFANGSYSALVD
jgi:CubicO group peptidase (beta-lactamase class C family)